jgi:cytochrome c biogenesis protein
MTDVRFTVVQIIIVVAAGLIGTLLRQIPASAFQDPTQYASELADLHARYDPLTILGVHVGPSLVDVFLALGFFNIFSAVWFTSVLSLLAVSIIVCTLDRTPRLWRGVHDVHPTQPVPFFDVHLNERAAFAAPALAPAQAVELLRRRRFKVRETVDADGVRHVYGDRNQYFKMATLLTHLGLILFLAGGAITGAFGFETVLFVGQGQTAPVQPVGTPDNLLIKNLGFVAPQRPDGTYEDYRTDLAVYQDGKQVAQATIRVNEPLVFDGFVFHQNTFGPAEELQIRTAAGALVWSGPMILDGSIAGQPQGFMTIPGAPIGLLGLLGSDAAGAPSLTLLGVAAGSDQGQLQPIFADVLGLGATSDPSVTGGYQVRWTQASQFSGMVVKKDPGQQFIWVAFLCLISGLILTFYFPRRRVWLRFDPDRVHVAMLADRYVAAEREFGQLLDGLAARWAVTPERART